MCNSTSNQCTGILRDIWCRQFQKFFVYLTLYPSFFLKPQLFNTVIEIKSTYIIIFAHFPTTLICLSRALFRLSDTAVTVTAYW